MSNPCPSGSTSLPTAILVAKRAPTKPASKSKPVFSMNLPWMKIAIGGTIAFQAFLAVMAIFYLGRGERQPIDDDFILRPVKNEMPVVKAQRPPVEFPEEPKAKEVAQEGDFEDAPLFNGAFVECARIGTDVRFMKEPAVAFQRARAEKKMVFMVHLSGNLEDKEFT